MTGSIRNFEKLNFTPKLSVSCFSQGQTSKYDRLAHTRLFAFCNSRLLKSHMRPREIGSITIGSRVVVINLLNSLFHIKYLVLR